MKTLITTLILSTLLAAQEIPTKTWVNAQGYAANAYCIDTGSTDTYACTPSIASPGSYSDGTHYLFRANTANTGAATLNLWGIGAIAIKKQAGGVTTDPSDNDIRVGQWVEVIYDATNTVLQMVSQLGNAATGGSGTVTNTGALTAHAPMLGNAGTDSKVVASLGLAGQVFVSNGAAADPSFVDPIVSGPAAEGATPVNNPVWIAGKGADGFIHSIRMANDGTVRTDPSGTTSQPVTQSTASNLNATVVGTGTFATQATLAAETTKVIGTVNQGTSPWVTSTTLGAETTKVIGTVNIAASQTVGLAAGSAVIGHVINDASAAVIGHVIADTGSTTAVTQATGTNLHAVVDSGSVTATQGTGTNLHTVVDSGSVTATQATGTNLHAVIDSGSTTVATQATAANLNATVVGTGTFAVQSAATLSAETTKVIGTVRVQGNVGGAFDAANNAAAPANVVVDGFEAATQTSTQPTAATAGNVRRAVISTDGSLYVRPHGPVIWSCGLAAIGTTLTQCQAAPGAGLRLYITDVVSQSNTATAGLFTLRFGTGSNCGTGTGNLIFSSASALMASPANTVAVNHFHLTTPIAVTANNAVCVLGVATNTTNIQINGYSAP